MGGLYKRNQPLLPYTNPRPASKRSTPASHARKYFFLSCGAIFLVWSGFMTARLTGSNVARADVVPKRPEARILAHEEVEVLHRSGLQHDSDAGDGLIRPPDEHQDGIIRSVVDREVASTPTAPAASGLYAMVAHDFEGREVPLSQFAGQVALVVNVASQCGFTDSNYRGLQALYSKYHSAGLEVLAFPCNQFGSQEPEDNAAIQAFAKERFSATFPIFAKLEVNGPNSDPIFQFLKRELPAEAGGGADLNWNFNKFLVDRAGRPVKHYLPQFVAEALERDVLAELGKPAL